MYIKAVAKAAAKLPSIYHALLPKGTPEWLAATRKDLPAFKTLHPGLPAIDVTRGMAAMRSAGAVNLRGIRARARLENRPAGRLGPGKIYKRVQGQPYGMLGASLGPAQNFSQAGILIALSGGKGFDPTHAPKVFPKIRAEFIAALNKDYATFMDARTQIGGERPNMDAVRSVAAKSLGYARAVDRAKGFKGWLARKNFAITPGSIAARRRQWESKGNVLATL